MQKNEQLKKIALLGLTSGLMIYSLHAEEKASYDPKEENPTFHTFSEEELFSLLSPKGKALYQSLSTEGKALAIELASQGCNGTNSCKGHNSCKTDQNDCAGLGSCKGKSKCAYADKNIAVKIAAKIMADKRKAALDAR